MRGLPAVSAYSSLVLGVMAFLKLLGSSGSTKVVPMPNLRNVTSNCE